MNSTAGAADDGAWSCRQGEAGRDVRWDLRGDQCRGDLAPGSAGPVLWADVLVPIIVLSLLAAHIRMGGMVHEREWRLDPRW